MRRAVRSLMKDNKKTTFILQLTAMVDMFTILIVFLLKSFSTSAVNITPHEGLTLPFSTSQTNPVEAYRIIVSTDGIYLDKEKVVEIIDGKIGIQDLDPGDSSFIRPLYKMLDLQAEKSREISDINEELKFDGKIVMQADSKLPYNLLRKIMYTSSLAGYAEFKLATFSE